MGPEDSEQTEAQGGQSPGNKIGFVAWTQHLYPEWLNALGVNDITRTITFSNLRRAIRRATVSKAIKSEQATSTRQVL